VIERIRLHDASLDEIQASLVRNGIRSDPAEILEVGRGLGRDLTVPEAFLIDVAFSEHCSYKSSRRFLKGLLPPLAPHVILGPGEDAGIVDLGPFGAPGWSLVVAHESHNHPSQLLPVEGAATGIGGIVRDVYCMGADVIGVLDGLRFGDLDGPNGEVARSVARGVVRGIWEYGDALGVPNLGGDLAFDRCYDDNCLVNVVALGIVPTARVIRSRVPDAAKDEPYDIVLVGKPTDRSGLGGASFASKVLDADAADSNLGAVQIHDPFLKRVIVEATKSVWDLLEARGCVAGFKDLGAGGFGGASNELVLAGGFGASIDLDQLPAAEEEPNPAHILVGETQERFVWAIPRRIVPDVLKIYNEDFDLPGIYPGARAAVVGKVIPEQRFEVTWRGEKVVDMPCTVLSETPVLERPTRPRPVGNDIGALQEPRDWGVFLERFVRHPALCSRAHVYRHYDAEVRGEALIRPGEADAGVCRPVPGSRIGIAVSLDGNGRWCDLDPYHGAVATVLESVRNVVAIGARPLALTDCMNFGSPEEPECLWEFEQCMLGMRDACVRLGLPADPAHALPIVSGNVSFYNQSASGKRIRPTPILACFGAIADWTRALRRRLLRPGNPVYLVASLERAWGGSPALDILGGIGAPPRPDIAAERERIYGVLEACEAGLVRSCHDFAEGGILMAAIEMLMHEECPTGLGLDLDLSILTLPPMEALLSESGGFLVEVDPEREGDFTGMLRARGVPSPRVGTVLDRPGFAVRAGDRLLFDQAVQPLSAAWSKHLGPWMEGTEA
jgi:phosphoribosylformylglycinamidine synthase subunit PurL